MASIPTVENPTQTPPSPPTTTAVAAAISPQHIRTSANSHMLNTTSASKNTSRRALKNELKNKIIFDASGDNIFYNILHADRVKLIDVEECVASLLNEKSADIEMLKSLAAQADKRKVEQLEMEEQEDNESSDGSSRGSSQEKKMYQPLLNIFNHITNFAHAGGPPTQPAQRIFHRTRGMLKPDWPSTSFPKVSPDMTVLNAKAPLSSKLWTDRDAFVEVKASNNQDPQLAKGTGISPILIQCADYARIFLSARPFMLSCVGILIFGTQFCVAVFDRDGITVSPSIGMFTAPEIYMFVRVVRSISHTLTDQELGFDPTAQLLETPRARTFIDQWAVQLNPGEKRKDVTGCPMFLLTVSPVGSPQKRIWCTIGPPIWTTVSLLGRGTTVWNVIEYNPSNGWFQGPNMILKQAWRNSSRFKEIDMYQHIQRLQPYPSGVAHFECGSDVVFPNSSMPITVDNLRCVANGHRCDPNMKDYGGGQTPVLHCLILSMVGRPLSKYSSDRELLMGMLDAIQAHEKLCSFGILHRDISPGNVFLVSKSETLPKDLKTGKVGVLCDFDCAKAKFDEILVPSSETHEVYTSERFVSDGMLKMRLVDRVEKKHTRFEDAVAIHCGVEFTGTAQFMAYWLLKDAEDGIIKIEHTLAHDVESFIWLLSFSVLTHLEDRAKATADDSIKKELPFLQELRNKCFGPQTTADIVLWRTSTSDTIRFPHPQIVERLKIKNIVNSYMSKQLIDVFKGFEKLLVFSQHLYEDPVTLTHKAVIDVINKALSEL